MKISLLLVLLTMVASCALTPQRSFLTEMEHDDSSLFEAGRDFPVVPGDTGRAWRGKKEWKKRIPASHTAQLREREKRSLEDDLKRLESKQSDGELAQYKKFRTQLGSTSERIYFLQIKGKKERDDYLASRGLIESEELMPGERFWATQSQEILVGMSKNDVEASWGRPERVDVAGNPHNENERWLYRRDGAGKYIYFEGGRVGGWSTASR